MHSNVTTPVLEDKASAPFVFSYLENILFGRSFTNKAVDFDGKSTAFFFDIQ